MSQPAVADRRLHPATLFIRFIKKVPEFVLGAPALIGFTSDAGVRLVLLIALAGAGVAFGIALLTWLRFRYGVGERDIVIESGVLNRQRRIIPFDRVQDIDIEQPLLARLFGTAKVKIETGGGKANEGELDTVSLVEAHRLRDIIRRGALDPVGEIAAESHEAAEPVLFSLGNKRLLLAGFFNFSLIYLAAVGAALQYFDSFINLRAIDPQDFAGPAAATSTELKVLAAVLAGAVLIILGVITGLVRTVLRDYGFRLSRAEAGLRRRRGLLTLSEVVIPFARIQLATLTSGPISRLLGWHKLELQTLNADARQSGHQSAVPFGRMHEIEPVLGETGFEALPPAEAYLRVSRRSIARRLLRVLVPAAIAIAAAALFWPPALAVFPFLLILAAAVVLQWRRHRYMLSDRALYVSEGFFRRRLWVVPYAKVQTISATRSPLQQQLGLASLTVNTAGASLFSYPLIRDVESATADELAVTLLERYKRARSEHRAASSPVHMIRPVDQRTAEPALDHERQRDGAERS